MHILKLILCSKPIVRITKDCSMVNHITERVILTTKPYIDCCYYSKHSTGYLLLKKAAQSVRRLLENLMSSNLMDYPGPGFGFAQTNWPCHFLRYLGLDRVLIHLPLHQSYFAGFALPSSWPTPVREVRHDRGGRYCVLYSVHKGAPVQQDSVSQYTVSETCGCIY